MKKSYKILLTGSEGQLGHDFKILFDSLKIEYIATDHSILDISDEESLRDFFEKNTDFTHIINCAAYNNVDKAESEKDECFRINMCAPEMIEEYSDKIGAVFITYSSDFVFNGEKKLPYLEEDKPVPLSIYGKSKYLMEQRILSKKGKTFIIRTSWLFGLSGENFNTQLINWSKSKDTLNIVDDQISAPTYSKDLALFSWKLIETEKYGLYHISNNGIASKYDQAEYVLGKIGWKGTLGRAKTEDFNLPAKRPSYSKLNSVKIESLLGEKIPSWQNAIDRFLEEMKENGKL